MLAALSAAGPQSRADLARSTGLSPTTVSSLVAELVADGQVVQTTDRGTPHKGGIGRPPLLLALATPPGCVAAVDIGHRHVKVAVADRSGRVLAEDAALLDVDDRGPATLERVAGMVRAVACGCGLAVEQLYNVAMCVPAPIDRSSRIASGILAGWRDIAPGEELARRLGRPVVVDNDANLGALAELHHGAGRGASDFVYVKIAGGVGAGIVLGGRLHRGTTGIAGEIGHVQVREDGEICRCGNRGCLQTETSLPRLLELLRPAHGETLDPWRVLELEADGDARVRRVFNAAGQILGRALADLCNNLNPKLLVLGGPLGCSPALLGGVRAAVDRYAQPSAAAAVGVRACELGGEAEIRGAIALAVARAAS